MFGKEASLQPNYFFVYIKFKIILKGFVCPNRISHFYLFIYFSLFSVKVTMDSTKALKFSEHPHPQKSSIKK